MDTSLPDKKSSRPRSRTRAMHMCPPPSTVAAFLDGCLLGQERELYLEHLRRCCICGDEVMELREVLANKASILEKVNTATPRRPVRIFRPRRAATLPPWAYVAAASVVAALLSIGLLSRPSGSGVANHVAQVTPTTSGNAEAAQPKQNPPAVANVAPAETPTRPQQAPSAASDVVEPPKSASEPGSVAQQPPDRSSSSETQAPAAPGAAPSERFEVASILGTTEVQAQGQKPWQTLKEGEMTRVAGRTALRTSGAQAARFSFGGYTVSAEKQSDMSLDLGRAGYDLSLDRGGVLLDADNDASREEVTVQAAGARIDAKGTRCAVHLDGKRLRIVALAGDLPVTSGGKSVRVQEGYDCVVCDGKAPQLGKAADLKACLAWTKDLEAYINVGAASGSSFQPLVRVVADASATGGKCVTSPRQTREDNSIWVEMTLDVKRAGTYRLFGRLALGEYKYGRGGLRVSVDGGEGIYLPLHASNPAWRWSEAEETVKLGVGRHTLRVMDPRGGHKIDCILVTTDKEFVADTAEEASNDSSRGYTGSEDKPRTEHGKDNGGPPKGPTHKGK